MKRFKPLIVFISVIVFMFIAYLIFNAFVEPKAYNFMIKTFSANEHGSKDIVLIVIDDKSISKERWPWKRELYAQMFEYLNEYSKPKIIGFDSIIVTPDKYNPQSDKKFFNTIKNYKNLVAGFSILFSKYPDKQQGLAYDKKFAEKFSIKVNNKINELSSNPYKRLTMFPDEYFNSINNVGSVLTIPHNDGYIRVMPQLINYKGAFYPSLTLKMYALLHNIDEFELTEHNISAEKLKIPTEDTSRGIMNYIHYYKLLPNSNYSHKTYSAIDIIDSLNLLKQGRTPIIYPNEFNDKIVFIGGNAKAAALGLEDALPSPLQDKHPGVDIQATNFDNLMNNEFISVIPAFQSFIIQILLIVATFLIVSFYPLLTSLGIISAMIIGYIILGICCFKFNLAIPIATPIALQFITMIFAYSNKSIIESKNKEKIKDAMGKYISQDIMQNVVKNIDEIKLGGKKANVTVLFADIRGFTSMSEKMEPDEISVILNEYFTEIEPIITKYNGVINKFIGDAVMAIFGEPVQDKDHPIKAVKCANAMLKKVEELQQKWLLEGKPKIQIGVGINTGEAFVGNIGSEKRLEYTVIGDMVNLASRIESYNKVYKTQFLISQSTYNYVKGIADVIKISEVTIRGKAKKMDIYEVLRLV